MTRWSRSSTVRAVQIAGVPSVRDLSIPTLWKLLVNRKGWSWHNYGVGKSMKHLVATVDSCETLRQLMGGKHPILCGASTILSAGLRNHPQ